MIEVLRFAILGAAAGGLYALVAQGIVLVYRGSGVLNLAQGVMGTIGAFGYWELRVQHGQSFIVSLLFGLLLSALSGLLTHFVVMKPMQEASAVTRLVATLAVLVIVQSALVIRYGTDIRVVHSSLPTDTWSIGSLILGKDRIFLFAIALVLTALLHLLYRWTRFGRATTAVAENARAASALGHSPNRIAAINWVLGSTLAGLAGILLAPIIGVQVITQTQLIVPALAAALVGGMSSFWLTLVGGVVVGVSQSEVARYVTSPGWGAAVPFLIIIAWMVIRGTGLPVRTTLRERLPMIGNGRIRPVVTAVAVGIALLLVWAIFDTSYVQATALTMAVAIILLSTVVVTGYTGQLSLCQYTLAGAGALITAQLVIQFGWPWPVAGLIAVVAAFPIGILVGLPALRLRGVNLAVVTLGIAVSAEAVVFDNTSYTNGEYTAVPTPHMFGMDVSFLNFPKRYATVCLIFLVLAVIVVANVRRGRSGRRLIAIRTNERAAAALGINVIGAKLYGFALASSVAALGGILLAFRQPNISFPGQFDYFQSITGVVNAVLGGVGNLAGPLVGSQGQAGTILPTALSFIGSNVALWFVIATSVLTIRVLQVAPDGVVSLQIRQLRALGQKLHIRSLMAPTRAEGPADAPRSRVVPKALEVRHLTVRFGGVAALSDFSVDVQPGEIVGLIGPNGAGKTTAIDAITGYVRPRTGTVAVDGRRVEKWRTYRRARAGMSRSFQQLELFEDLSAFDNLRTAGDPHDVASYVVECVKPQNTALTPYALAAVAEFGLAEVLDEQPANLSYGRRRLLAIARAVATGPSILLLDEPAAGLSDVETRELGVLLRRLADEWGMAILLVDHDVPLVTRLCDRITVLDFGKQIATGTPDEIVANQDVISVYLGEPPSVDGESADAGGDVVAKM